MHDFQWRVLRRQLMWLRRCRFVILHACVAVRHEHWRCEWVERIWAQRSPFTRTRCADCDPDDRVGCASGLVCGVDNCGRFHEISMTTGFHAATDCCEGNCTATHALITCIAYCNICHLFDIFVFCAWTRGKAWERSKACTYIPTVL